MRWFWALGEKSRCCAPDLEESWALEDKKSLYAPQEILDLKLGQKFGQSLGKNFTNTHKKL